MARQEAIKKLRKRKAEYLDEWVDYSGIAEAYDMAIEALEKEPNDDCISRATALEIYSDLYWMDERLLNFKDELDNVYEKLRNAPSVVPKEGIEE